MKTQILGRLTVFQLGFDTMSFASTYGPPPETSEAIAMIRGAYDQGIATPNLHVRESLGVSRV